MAGRNKMWQKIERTDGVKEHFLIGRFIQSDTWTKTDPPAFERKAFPKDTEKVKFPYHKDGFEYSGKPYTFDNAVSVTEITHATEFCNINDIIKNGGFKSTEKCCPGIGLKTFVWFGLKIGEEEIDRLNENSVCTVHSLLPYEPKQLAKQIIIQSKFTQTPAFQPASRYGHCKFILGIRDVLEAYKTQFCGGWRAPEMRKLGTFAYRQETIHAILVCPPGTTDIDMCPELNNDPIMKPDARFETWTWKPHSTGRKQVSVSFENDICLCPSDIRWEHLVFAFSVPGDKVMKIDNLENRLSFCLRITENHEISGFNQLIYDILESIPCLKDEKISRVNMLISMIAGYLNEEPLYKKTMDWHYEEHDEEHKRVQFEPVVQCLVNCLAPFELKDVNWSPLNKWMDSLTTHSNVLHAIHKYGIRF